MSVPPSSRPPRDTDATPFALILAHLVARLPGALGASLVDDEGECVDYTGRLDPFDLKVMAAHFSIVLSEARTRLAAFGGPRSLLIRSARKSFIVQALHDGYAVVVILRARAGFAVSSRALALCERALAVEANWPAPPGPFWHPIRVELSNRRPTCLASESTDLRGVSSPRKHAVEVLGALVPVDDRERGYRVRLDTGAELTIVREGGGFWYADEPVPTASARESRS